MSGGNRLDFQAISDFCKNNVEQFVDFFKQIVQIAMDLG